MAVFNGCSITERIENGIGKIAAVFAAARFISPIAAKGTAQSSIKTAANSAIVFFIAKIPPKLPIFAPNKYAPCKKLLSQDLFCEKAVRQTSDFNMSTVESTN